MINIGKTRNVDLARSRISRSHERENEETRKLDAIGRKRVAKFRVSEARYVRELILEGLDPPRDRNRT